MWLEYLTFYRWEKMIEIYWIKVLVLLDLVAKNLKSNKRCII